MASPIERSRNNIRAGIFVTGATLLAVVTIVVLTDVWGAVTIKRHEYVVMFEVSDGVKNIQAGADVRVGGVYMGRVKAVTPRLAEDEAFTKIEVTIEVREDLTLYEGAFIVVTSAVIGDNAWLDIFSTGNPAAGEPADLRFEGSSAPGILGSLLGPEGGDDAGVMLTNLRISSENVRELTERINQEDWPRWARSVDKVMDWATGATDNIDGMVNDGRVMLQDFRAVVTDNRPKIDSTVDNLDAATANAREITQRFKDQTLDKVDKLLDTGQRGLDAATAVIEGVSVEWDIWAVEIRDALASARMAAQQLKIAVIEVRRSPWRILYRPSRQELEHEKLYEATRSFAMAASDLKAASESARRLVDHHAEEIALDPDTKALVNDMLRDSIERYQKAQQRLAAVLFAK